MAVSFNSPESAVRSRWVGKRLRKSHQLHVGNVLTGHMSNEKQFWLVGLGGYIRSVSSIGIIISQYRCFRKLWYPQIILFDRFSIINHPFWGTPVFWKHPYKDPYKYETSSYQFNSCSEEMAQIWIMLRLELFTVPKIEGRGEIFPGKHLSNEKKPGCLGYIGDYTNRLYRD